MDDILIGVHDADRNGVDSAGETYVVFGGAATLSAHDALDGGADGQIELLLPTDLDPFIF